MLVHAFTWSKTLKKVLFYNFQAFFIVFDYMNCEGMRKHEFAGRNIEQLTLCINVILCIANQLALFQTFTEVNAKLMKISKNELYVVAVKVVL